MYSQHAALVRRVAPRYAKSIDDLMAKMNMPETISSVADLKRLGELSPYFADEHSDLWRNHFKNSNPVFRSAESTRRRIWVFFSEARFKKMCAYCWLQVHCCVCERILKRSPEVQQAMMDPNYTNVLACVRENNGNCPTSSDTAGCDDSSLPPRPQCKVTIILHAHEILRMTNSAHIAAMAMNAGMLVWGLPEHDERISSLGRYWVANPPPKGCGLGWPIDHSLLSFDGTSITTSSCEQHGLSSDNLSSSGGNLQLGQKKPPKSCKERTEPIYQRTTTNSVMRRKKTLGGEEGGSDLELDEDELADTQDMSVLLYPAVDASIPFAQLLAYRESLARRDILGKESADSAENRSPASDLSPETHDDNLATKKAPPALHIYLSDGTWSQARVVNRQVPLHMPRVALEISPRYGALFQGLRKRTRESGVSTLEATTIAVSQAVARDTSCSLFRVGTADKMVEVDFITNAGEVDGSADAGSRSSSVSSAHRGGGAVAAEGGATYENNAMDCCDGACKKLKPLVTLKQTRLKGSVAAAATASDDELDEAEIMALARTNTKCADALTVENSDPTSTPTTTADADLQSTSKQLQPSCGVATVAASVLAFESALFDLMRQFVDIVAIISTKHYARQRQTSLSPSEVKQLVDGENAYKVEIQRLIEEAAEEPTGDSVRHLLPAPVTNFCYVCDVFTGYERMVRHVAGKEHKKRLAEKPTGFEPSAASSKKVKKTTGGVVPFDPDSDQSRDDTGN